MYTFYNEIDPYCLNWLKNLMFAGHISPGRIDARPIQELVPRDIPYSRAHFFTGVAGWEYALKLAGWPSNIHTWTGSCPCQPFSIAGKQHGIHDSRHLWPVWYDLISICRPAIIFGEQVSSKQAIHWLERVFIDLEASSYAVAGAVIPACSVGAPHKRDRLWWVAVKQDKISGRADANGRKSSDRNIQRSRKHGQQPEDSSVSQSVGDTKHLRPFTINQPDLTQDQRRLYERQGPSGGDRTNARTNNQHHPALVHPRPQRRSERFIPHPDQLSAWSPSITIPCADNSYRRIPVPESGIHPLAHGVSGRVGRLRGYGNSIVPQTAAAFITSVMEALNIEPVEVEH